jgi:nicotinamidase-related amidase
MDYFPGGNRELYRSEAASLMARELLDAFRQAELRVIHVQHVATRAGATSFIPGTPGVEIHPNVAPLPGEKVVIKHFANSFRETGLLEFLKQEHIERLVICGMQTNMCIDGTTRAASDLGFTCLVAADACAARDLSYAGQTVPAEQVHTAFLAALNGSYAKVLPNPEILAELVRDQNPA